MRRPVQAPRGALGAKQAEARLPDHSLLAGAASLTLGWGPEAWEVGFLGPGRARGKALKTSISWSPRGTAGALGGPVTAARVCHGCLRGGEWVTLHGGLPSRSAQGSSAMSVAFSQGRRRSLRGLSGAESTYTRLTLTLTMLLACEAAAPVTRVSARSRGAPPWGLRSSCSQGLHRRARTFPRSGFLLPSLPWGTGLLV